MDEQLLRDDKQDSPYHPAGKGRGKTKLTYEQYKEAKRCHEIRSATPTMSQLARRFGVTAETLVATLRRGVKQYDQRMHR